MRLTERLVMYYERGATSRRASIETGILLSEVRDQFRRFHRLGIKRLGRHFMLPEWRSAAAYTGPDWIGVAVARTVPMKAGPDWIGERAHSTTVRRPLH